MTSPTEKKIILLFRTTFSEFKTKQVLIIFIERGLNHFHKFIFFIAI